MRDSPAFTLRLGALGSELLAVSGFSGTEGLSRLFDFRVDFFVRDGEPLAVADLVGRDALLTIAVRAGSPRCVHGQVRGVEALGVKTGRRRYRAHVVPRPWRLSQVHRSRIFQGRSVPDIIKAVLGEGGVEVRLALSGTYAAREYCVQYRESDFAFVSRLMECRQISRAATTEELDAGLSGDHQHIRAVCIKCGASREIDHASGSRAVTECKNQEGKYGSPQMKNNKALVERNYKVSYKVPDSKRHDRKLDGLRDAGFEVILVKFV